MHRRESRLSWRNENLSGKVVSHYLSALDMALIAGRMVSESGGINEYFANSVCHNSSARRSTSDCRSGITFLAEYPVNAHRIYPGDCPRGVDNSQKKRIAKRSG